ncbi:MAG: hypothetical protein H0X17_12265, partial [Deltaproteobacteria bacterium]|nr:hypothetical protein [Deltaproteobacteria bacterium]
VTARRVSNAPVCLPADFYREEFLKHRQCLALQREYFSERAIIDADAALARCDAGTALAAIGALVVTGPTGVNHADVVILG